MHRVQSVDDDDGASNGRAESSARRQKPSSSTVSLFPRRPASVSHVRSSKNLRDPARLSGCGEMKGRDEKVAAALSLWVDEVARRSSAGRTASLHRLAAIDDHGVPDDEGGRVRTQPNDGRSDLLGLSHPADRLLRDHPRPPLGGASAEPVHHRGVDDPRAHGVHADVRLRVIEGRRLRETDDAEFRGAVRGLTCECL